MYYDPYGLRSSIGIGGQIGSTTLGVQGGYGWYSGSQWGQTTQIGVGFGVEACFNLPDEEPGNDGSVSSDCNENNTT